MSAERRGKPATARHLTTAVLSRPAQVKALSQPIRLEIVEAFRPGEALGVEELAARLGRKPVSLYFHVRKLVANGILVAADQRRGVGRPQALYRPAADRLVVDPGGATAAGRNAGLDAVRATLRAAEGDVRRAFRHSSTVTTGSFQVVGQRMKGRLTTSELSQVQRHLDALQELFLGARSRRRGRLVAVTTILVPVPEAGDTA
jgi:hypothetical protein